ncbi:MAG: hypothetical protein JRJ33_10845, partial [Deltaproteobacteria bacterium]|nr:hypothetical protein [Deltaproteobacteria bacterium]
KDFWHERQGHIHTTKEAEQSGGNKGSVLRKRKGRSGKPGSKLDEHQHNEFAGI